MSHIQQLKLKNGNSFTGCTDTKDRHIIDLLMTAAKYKPTTTLHDSISKLFYPLPPCPFPKVTKC